MKGFGAAFAVAKGLGAGVVIKGFTVPVGFANGFAVPVGKVVPPTVANGLPAPVEITWV